MSKVIDISKYFGSKEKSSSDALKLRMLLSELLTDALKMGILGRKEVLQILKLKDQNSIEVAADMLFHKITDEKKRVYGADKIPSNIEYGEFNVQDNLHTDFQQDLLSKLKIA